MNGWLLKDIHFVWSETLTMLTGPLKLSNPINIFLIKPNTISTIITDWKIIDTSV